MLVVNVDYVSDKELVFLELVKGNGTNQVFSTAQDQAMEEMMKKAKKLEADAIINVKFQNVVLGNDEKYVMAYGTAVKYRVTYELQQF